MKKRLNAEMDTVNGICYGACKNGKTITSLQSDGVVFRKFLLQD